jgi:hypothetical protein
MHTTCIRQDPCHNIKEINNVPCTTNNQTDRHIRIHISEIIKYTVEYIKQKTQRALIFASKRSPTGCRPRTFLPTIDVVVHLLSTTGHPRARAMNPQGWVLGQV